MKTITLIITCLLSYQFSIAQADIQKTYTITAKVPNVYEKSGTVIFALHTEETFMKKPVDATVIIPENGTATATFTNVAPGIYAILVLHDKNENNQMDFAENGMPLEPYGVSNNNMSFGPPQFSNAKFEVDKDLSLEIKF